LLAIAEQTAPATARVGRPAVLGVAALPGGTVTQSENSLKQTLGQIGGFVALITLPLLAIPLLKRRREVAKLRAQVAATLHFESRLLAATGLPAAPALPAGAGVAPRPTGPAGWTPTAYHTRRVPFRARLLAGTGAVLLAAVGVLGLVINFEGTSGAKRVRVHQAAPTIPTVPVAVLNATNTQGAAGQLAKRLRVRGINVATVGNLSESRPPGFLILYAPGNRGQATVLARVLSGQHPTVEPIDPVAQAAAGTRAKLVVVIA
jgi:hypothetical protein